MSLPKNSLVPVVLNTLSLIRLITLFSSIFFPKRKKIPPFSFSLLIYRYTPCSYPYGYPIANSTLRDIFLTLSISTPSLSLNFVFWEIFLLFRLCHMYLMRQRLGKGSLINAKVKIFNLLACLGSFLWSWAPPGSFMWIIRTPRFK